MTWTFDLGLGPFTIIGNEKGGLIVGKTSGEWAVTHAASGLRVIGFLGSRARANKARELLLPLADWTLSMEVTKATEGLKDKVHAIVDALYEEADSAAVPEVRP